MAVQLITVENQAQTVTEEEHQEIVAALQAQVSTDYHTSGWVKRGLAPPGEVQALASGQAPPVGAWNLIIMDHSDQQGALGYHDDEQGNNIPYSEIFAVDSREDGSTVSAVASHEMLEMLCDPYVEIPVPKHVVHDGQAYILEVCDAVQGNDYQNPEGPEGYLVADFVLPCWFGLAQFDEYSFRNSVGGAFEIAPEGYISVCPAAEVSDASAWKQIFGAQQDRVPKWASRLPRIHKW